MILTTEEIVELRRLISAEKDAWNCDDVYRTRQNLMVFVKHNASALLQAAEIAARIPAHCCLTCAGFQPISDFSEGLCHLRKQIKDWHQAIVCGMKCEEWEVMP